MIGVGNKSLTFAEGIASSPNIKQGDLLVYHKSDSILEKLSTDNRFSISNSLE